MVEVFFFWSHHLAVSCALCLQTYAPYQRAHWVKRWQETKTRDLDAQIKTIVKELKEAAPLW